MEAWRSRAPGFPTVAAVIWRCADELLAGVDAISDLGSEGVSLRDTKGVYMKS